MSLAWEMLLSVMGGALIAIAGVVVNNMLETRPARAARSKAAKAALIGELHVLRRTITSAARRTASSMSMMLYAMMWTTERGQDGKDAFQETFEESRKAGDENHRELDERLANLARVLANLEVEFEVSKIGQQAIAQLRRFDLTELPPGEWKKGRPNEYWNAQLVGDMGRAQRYIDERFLTPLNQLLESLGGQRRAS